MIKRYKHIFTVRKNNIKIKGITKKWTYNKKNQHNKKWII